LHHYFYYAYQQIYEVHLLVNRIEILRNAWHLQYQDLHHYVVANLQSVAGHNSRKMSVFFSMGDEYYALCPCTNNADRCMLNIIKTESLFFTLQVGFSYWYLII